MEEEEGYEEEEGEQEEYEDDGFVGESENDPVEDEEVVTDDNDFGEEDCMLDVEIEDLSGKTTGLKGKKEVLSLCLQLCSVLPQTSPTS